MTWRRGASPAGTMGTGVRPAGTMAAGVLAAAAILGGCGGATKTVSVASLPVSTSTSTATTSNTTTGAATSTSATSATSTAATTRTASAPAFTYQSATTGTGVAAAAGVVRAHGYTPEDIGQYHPGQTLRVLVGTRTGAGDGYGQQAFFFLDGRYIGTDASRPSATLRVVSQSDTAVTLAYPLYRAQDPLSSPSGGEARVTFQLDNGRLTPQQTIPPASSSTGLSRQ